MTAIDQLAAARPRDEAAGVARAEAAQLKPFLDSLVDMVRIDNGAITLPLEPIDLTDGVASAVHDLEDLLRRHPIDLQAPADLSLVEADPTLLHHILLNLIANAAIRGGDERRIAIIGERTHDVVALAVRRRFGVWPPT